MLSLPPPISVGRPERRSRERRATDRRSAVEAVVADDSAGSEPDDRRFSADDGSARPPAFRSRGGARGRRKSDRGAAAEADGESAFVRPSKPHAPLVAQLIANELDLEQTRLRRRGSVEQAAALYGRKAERAKPSRGEA